MLAGQAIGNLGNDAELKYSANGAPMLRFNVATNGRRRDQDGNWNDHTEWLRVTVFGQRAETLSQYLSKGTRVFVSGRLEARPWTAQDGSQRAGLELIADTCEFMSSRQDEQSAAPRQRQEGGRGSVSDDDSDLPF